MHVFCILHIQSINKLFKITNSSEFDIFLMLNSDYFAYETYAAQYLFTEEWEQNLPMKSSQTRVKILPGDMCLCTTACWANTDRRAGEGGLDF